MTPSLVLVGCGKMGGALLDGWLDRGLERNRVVVVEPEAATADAVALRFGVTVIEGPGRLERGARPEVVVFAVKPQVMDGVVPAYKPLAGGGTVFLSIAAGKTIEGFERYLGDGAAIVRSMPNTPAAVRRGMTVACANRNTSAEQMQRCQTLLEAVGAVAWVDDEALLDAVTAVSGSGPAYVFLLVECLARAGVAEGLPEGLAAQIARATVSGAGTLLDAATEPPDILRRNVTSPGGTTAAALDVLMAEDGLAPLLARAVAAATIRSRQLAG